MRRSAETPLRNKERETIMLFEILKRSPRPVVSLLTPASGQGYALPMSGLIGYMRGTPMQESATAGQAELADGTKPFAGFMTRDSQALGPVLGMTKILTGAAWLVVAAFTSPPPMRQNQPICRSCAGYLRPGVRGLQRCVWSDRPPAAAR